MKTFKKLAFIIIFSLPYFSLKAQHQFAIINTQSWLFMNIDNPLNFTLQEIPNNEIKIISNLGHIIKVDSNGRFIINPKSSVSIKLKVYRFNKQDSILIHERHFSVKPMPKPTARYGNLFKNEMTKSEFLHQRGIRADVLNYDYGIRIPVESFTLIVIKEKELLYFEDCTGYSLKTDTKEELEKLLNGGERVLFTNLKIKPFYHFNQYINSIEIRIKD